MRRCPRRTRRGFLLVEALLALVVIATGLVFISRALSANLAAVTHLQRTARVLRLAASALRAREIDAQQFGASDGSTGAFDPPDEAYRWSLALQAAPVPLDEQVSVTMSSVTLTVTAAGDDRPLARLHTLWPAEWVQP